MLIKFMTAMLVGAVVYPLFFKFIKPRVHYLVEGGLNGLMISLLPRASVAMAHRLGWVSSGTTGIMDYAWMSMGLVFEGALIIGVGTYLGWFKESPSMARAMERARERRLAAKEAAKLREGSA